MLHASFRLARVDASAADKGLVLSRGPAALTPAEWRVMRALATGAKIRTVADDLGIGYQTAKNHLTSIYEKLDAVGMVDAFVILGWLRAR